MNKNLKKILATIGLIVAIFLIFKGVFDVGKVGVKKISNKDFYKFDKCWAPYAYKNYEEHFKAEDFDEWYFELNLEKGVVVRTTVRKDEAIKKWKLNHNIVVTKVELDNYPIKSATNTYVETYKREWMDGAFANYFVFNLKNGEVIMNSIKPQPDSSTLKCEKF